MNKEKIKKLLDGIQELLNLAQEEFEDDQFDDVRSSVVSIAMQCRNVEDEFNKD